MKRLNADTTVHLARVQAFFYKLESVAGEKIFFLYLFGKKNGKITTKCLTKGPIVSYLSAALSCEQRPFFLVTLRFSETLSFCNPKLNPVNQPNREHRRKQIP